MNPKEINWRDMTEMPDPGTTVLIHVPHDDEPVWFGFWDGSRWHYIEGLPVRGVVKHWCGVPTPPEKDWVPVPVTEIDVIPASAAVVESDAVLA